MRFRRKLSVFKLLGRLSVFLLYLASPVFGGGVITLDGDLTDFQPYQLDWLLDEPTKDAAKGYDFKDLYGYAGPAYDDSFYVAFTLRGRVRSDSILLHFISTQGDTFIDLLNLSTGRCVTVNQKDFECGIPWSSLPVSVHGDVVFLQFFSYNQGAVEDSAPDFGFYVLPIPVSVKDTLIPNHGTKGVLDSLLNPRKLAYRILGRKPNRR